MIETVQYHGSVLARLESKVDTIADSVSPKYLRQFLKQEGQ